MKLWVDIVDHRIQHRVGRSPSREGSHISHPWENGKTSTQKKYLSDGKSVSSQEGILVRICFINKFQGIILLTVGWMYRDYDPMGSIKKQTFLRTPGTLKPNCFCTCMKVVISTHCYMQVMIWSRLQLIVNYFQVHVSGRYILLFGAWKGAIWCWRYVKSLHNRERFGATPGFLSKSWMPFGDLQW